MSETLRQVLLSPRSVAIVGQSNDASKTAGRPLKYLRRAGYGGRIFPVNARRGDVLGERAYPSLSALPEVPEHAYVVTATDAAIAAVEEAGEIGVKVATLLANGFAESGPAGVAREDKLRAICARTGIRIVGPSSLGVVNLRQKVLLTANAAFDEDDLPVGRIFAASHSGSMIGALVSRGKTRGVGFASLVSVGNEVDLSIGEICAATLDDPDIDGYLLFLETMRRAADLRAFAVAAAVRGKPILAYKLGRSEEARELAVSHTGALAGEDDIAEAFLRDCGIARVDTLDGLVEGLPLLDRVPIGIRAARTPTVGVVTTTAGGATMVIDPLASRGVRVEAPSAETLSRLSAAGIDVAPARLIDLTVAGTRYDVMKAALEILTTAPEFDLLVAVVGSSARFHPELAVRPIADSATARKPIAAFLVPDAPEALAQLSQAGVPNFRTPEACADAIAAALSRRSPKPIVAHNRPNAGGACRMLDELAAYALLDRMNIPRAPSFAVSADIREPPALPFPYPVVVKALSAEIAHKSDVGGVALGIGNGTDLLAAIAGIRRSIHMRTGLEPGRMIVQPMIVGLGEVLIGYRVDRDVGPLVMVAAGGIMTEVMRDRSLRLAPVDLAGARDMISEVRALKVLAGVRGRPAGDLDGLADAIVALSKLATMADPAIAEAEINPLIILPSGQGVVAVDALVKVSEKG